MRGYGYKKAVNWTAFCCVMKTPETNWLKEFLCNID